MRTTLSLVAAGLLLAAAPASAQQSIAMPATSGVAEFGARYSDISGDAARYQRYRDRRDGGTLDLFRFERQGATWWFDSGAEHVGYKDQRYFASFRSDKVRAAFSWDQIPLFDSADARSLYRSDAPGVFRLDDAIQSGAVPLASLTPGAPGVDLRSYRHVAAFDFSYMPTKALDVGVKVRQSVRRGSTPWSGPFAFYNVVELAAPVDTRTSDVDATVQWTGPRGMLRLGYGGSWFDNNVPTLVWDNPLALNDTVSPTGYIYGNAGAQGQAALWPTNDMQSTSMAGMVRLPGRTRVNGNVTLGLMRQNTPLLPVTINTALSPIPLPRATAEAEGRTTAMTYSLTSNPGAYVWLNARYRYYDYDNRTPELSLPNFLVMDQTVHGAVKTHPISYTRQNLDLDAALTPAPFASVRAGYSRANDDRTHRIFTSTTEETFRTSLDATPGRYVTVRAIVERSRRRGAGLDEEMLLEAGEQPAMRHFDIADRDRDRVTALVQVTPNKYVGLSAAAAVGDDEYKDSGFGLRDNTNRAYTFTLDVSATRVGATVSYVRERYAALQNSRNASPGPQVTDPTRNWSIDSSDRVNTVTAGLDLLKLLPRTDVRLTYDFTRSRAAYLYVVPANSTLAALLQLPTVEHELQAASGDVRFALSRNVALGAVYWYDRYDVDDFSFSETTLSRLALPGSLFLGSVYRPYLVKSGALRLICTW